MSELKRFPIKYIRDYIKKDYKLRDECLHHLYSVSQLFNDWCTRNKITEIDTVEKITSLREEFAVDCKESLDHHNLFTLCKSHHQRLHAIYGQRYSNHLTLKIKNWLNIQREKYGRQ